MTRQLRGPFTLPIAADADWGYMALPSPLTPAEWARLMQLLALMRDTFVVEEAPTPPPSAGPPGEA